MKEFSGAHDKETPNAHAATRARDIGAKAQTRVRECPCTGGEEVQGQETGPKKPACDGREERGQRDNEGGLRVERRGKPWSLRRRCPWFRLGGRLWGGRGLLRLLWCRGRSGGTRRGDVKAPKPLWRRKLAMPGRGPGERRLHRFGVGLPAGPAATVALGWRSFVSRHRLSYS